MDKDQQAEGQAALEATIETFGRNIKRTFDGMSKSELALCAFHFTSAMEKVATSKNGKEAKALILTEVAKMPAQMAVCMFGMLTKELLARLPGRLPAAGDIDPELN